MAKKIDLVTALRIIEAAKKKAREIKVAMNIAVVDAGNNLVAFQRLDGAWLGSINISMNKAYTARAFDMETKTLAPLCQPGQPLYGIHASN
ncbi:MAG: heme-binding protein, partial [Deltaproteobacteria bacterium]|nr:heme-binding protein [Deltaproteobacteria bacterium]